MSASRHAIAAVLVSSALFGASTPFARALVGDVSPMWLAALLYCGSGVGLSAVLLVRRRRGGAGPAIARADVGWLAGAIVAGGIAAPLLFTTGLARTSGATASLLLNLETVLTVVLAWFAFGEHRNARVVLGMTLIVGGCVVLGWPGADAAAQAASAGAPWIVLACACWAIDNNLTRRVAANDATAIAAAKGCVGGAVNLALAAALEPTLPAPAPALAAAVVGFLGYGVSLVLFVISLRELGVARASAYYGSAPFFGVAAAFALLHEPPDGRFAVALPLMAIGVWLHLTERHRHTHTHEVLTHTHPHRHDGHHRHAHAFEWDGTEPHVHPHTHEPLVHAHRHTPDLHHRHGH